MRMSRMPSTAATGQINELMTVTSRLDAGNTDSALNCAGRPVHSQGFRSIQQTKAGLAGIIGVGVLIPHTTDVRFPSTVTRTHGRGTDACFRRG